MYQDLLIVYCEKSDVGLGNIEEDNLVQMLAESGSIVEFQKNDLPVAGAYSRPVGSWVAESVNLLLVISGGIITKATLQNVIKELYFYFNLYLQRKQNQEGDPIHYGVLFDVRSKDNKYYVAISFKDKETMDIAFSRLAEFVDQNSVRAHYHSTVLLELTYPTGFNPRYLVPVIVVTVAAPWFLWGIKITISDLLPVLAPIADIGYPIILIILLPILWFLAIVRPWYREKEYRDNFRQQAKKWAEQAQKWAREVQN